MKQAWLVVAVVILQSSSRVQLFATPWTAACQASCHPLSSPSPPTFNLSRIRVFCHVKYSFWEKKKGLGICKTSQFAPYFTIQKIYFHHLRGKTTIDLKSVTFYHHCVFAKARNHLYCPIRTVLYTDFGLQ